MSQFPNTLYDLNANLWYDELDEAAKNIGDNYFAGIPEVLAKDKYSKLHLKEFIIYAKSKQIECFNEVIKLVNAKEWQQVIAHSKYAFQLIDTHYNRNELIERIKWLCAAYEITLIEVDLHNNFEFIKPTKIPCENKVQSDYNVLIDGVGNASSWAVYPRWSNVIPKFVARYSDYGVKLTHEQIFQKLKYIAASNEIIFTEETVVKYIKDYFDREEKFKKDREQWIIRK